jgi:hypothetical protein
VFDRGRDVERIEAGRFLQGGVFTEGLDEITQRGKPTQGAVDQSPEQGVAIGQRSSPSGGTLRARWLEGWQVSEQPLIGQPSGEMLGMK